MTHSESAKLMAARAATWLGHPSAAPPSSDSEFLAVAQVLADVSFNAALEQLGAHRGDPHPPTPGQLAAWASTDRVPSWDEAWLLIQRACSRHGTQDRAGGVASLPRDVGAWASPRWRDLCMAEWDGEEGGFIMGRWRREWREFRDDPSERQRVLQAHDRRLLGDGPGLAELEAQARAAVEAGS